MKFSPGTTRACMVALAFGVGLCAWAQEPSPSLGDVARKTRKEHAASDHVAARPSAREDEDGPDSSGVWRVKLCVQNPCVELSVTLPKSPKWSRQGSEPRPVMIPLLGHEEDASRAIRVFAAESLGPSYSLDIAKRTFLQGWFARPEYFGQGAHLVLDEHLTVDDRVALVTHFTVIAGVQKYRGLSVVAGTGTGTGNFGFACVFRDEDANAATSVCEAIVRSARAQTLQPATPRYYPTYYPPSYPRYDDPRDDPPDNDDPE
ncbi:MAG TPA: hypothetical protein VFE61_22930 [Candidatus Sulfotelmatobacter sp.]|nr:hypothetical protein [Candidatus Sulfotelmatobacter sp.]